MAIIREYHFGGQTARIDDTYICGVPEEELRRRRERARDIIGGIMYRQQMRELEKAERGDSTG